MTSIRGDVSIASRTLSLPAHNTPSSTFVQNTNNLVHVTQILSPPTSSSSPPPTCASGERDTQLRGLTHQLQETQKMLLRLRAEWQASENRNRALQRRVQDIQGGPEYHSLVTQLCAAQQEVRRTTALLTENATLLIRSRERYERAERTQRDTQAALDVAAFTVRRAARARNAATARTRCCPAVNWPRSGRSLLPVKGKHRSQRDLR